MKKNMMFDGSRGENFDAHFGAREDAALVSPELVSPAEELIRAWYREHALAVYRYLQRRFGRTAREHGGEIVNDAFLRLFQAIEAGHRIEKPRAWALTVARRLALDQIRRNGGDEKKRLALAQLTVSRAPDPYDELCEQQRRAMLPRAWQTLSAIERQCMRLRANGWTAAEIGERHDLDRRRVAEIVARAWRKLEKSW